MFPSIEKDPGARLPYGRDWSGWLEAGDTLTASTWTATPDGLTLSGSTFQASGATSVMVAGGVAGTDYLLTNHVTTAPPKSYEDERTLKVKTKER